MTVNELKAILDTLPGETLVLATDYEEGCHELEQREVSLGYAVQFTGNGGPCGPYIHCEGVLGSDDVQRRLLKHDWRTPGAEPFRAVCIG